MVKLLMKGADFMNRQSMVEFSFMIKNYVPYALRDDPEQGTNLEPKKIKGVKSFKRFASWFKLMKNRNRLIVGVVRDIETDEHWIWQKPVIDRFGRKIGGWQKALDGNLREPQKPVQLTLF